MDEIIDNVQPIDEVPNASSLLNAKILGIDNVGGTKLFKITDIKGDFKGIAESTTNPGTPVLAQYYIGKPGVTYPNFLDHTGVAISVPLLDASQTVFDAKMTWSGTSWELTFSKASFDDSAFLGYKIPSMKEELNDATGAMILNENRSQISFEAEAASNFYFGESDVFVTKDRKFNRLYFNSDRAGACNVAFVSIVAGVGTIVYLKEILLAGQGVYEFTAENLVLPDLSGYDKLQVMVGNVSPIIGERPLKYNYSGTVKSMEMSTATLAVTEHPAGTYFFNFWIETATSYLPLPQVKNKIDALVSPKLISADRSSYNYPGICDAQFLFSEESFFLTPLRIFKQLFVKAPVAGPLEINFVTIDNNLATFLFQKIVNVPVGISQWTTSDLEVPDLTGYEKVSVFFRNINTTPASQPFRYTTEFLSPSIAYSQINIHTNVYQLSTPGTLSLNCWFEFEEVKSKISFVSGSNDYYELTEALSNNNEVFVRDGNHIFRNTVVVPSGKTIYGTRKAVVKPKAGLNLLFDISSVSGVKLSGFTLLGNGATIDQNSNSIISTADDLEINNGIGSGRGIRVSGTQDTILDNLLLKNFDSDGIYSEYVNPLTGGLFGRGFTISAVHVESCYHGVRAGEQAEYSRYEGISASRCLSGITIRCGNIAVSNSHFTQNRVNAYVGSGGNNSHGTFSGCFFNHSPFRGLIVKSIDHGMVFADCQFFDGLVEIINSRGAHIEGGIMASEIRVAVNNGQRNKISNMMFTADGAYNVGVITKSGDGTLTLLNNHFMDERDYSSINGEL